MTGSPHQIIYKINSQPHAGRFAALQSQQLRHGRQRRHQVLSSIDGHDISFFQVPIDQVRQQSEDMAAMYEWFERDGYDVDIERLCRAYPEVSWHTYRDWAHRQDWTFLD